MFRKLRAISLFFLVIFSSLNVLADKIGDEVEINSGVVTALTCAADAQKTGNLNLLSDCSLAEVNSGYVVFDVTEKKFYLISDKSNKKVYLFEMEKAFGGGRIDLNGTVVDIVNGIPVVETKEYSIVPKPKAGNFKGCL